MTKEELVSRMYFLQSRMVTLDGADQDRIKAAVHQRFLRDGMSVADWINGGVTPSWWLESDEEEFRAMAKKAFAPKEEA